MLYAMNAIYIIKIMICFKLTRNSVNIEIWKS